MSFTVVCNKCSEWSTFNGDTDTRGSQIELEGEVSSDYEPSAFIECKNCYNNIEVWRGV